MSRAKKIKQALKKLLIALFFLSLGQVLLYKWVNPPTTLTMWDQESSLGKPMTQTWVNIESISKNMQLAIICAEDQTFNNHWGFDFKALKSAATSNAKGNKRRGGSTISQQTAKNVFLWQGGGYLRKGLETWYTILIEIFWSKKRIMEIYLNVAETGIGTFGIEAGAQRYFHCSAKKLSIIQAAKIASLWPCPRRCGFQAKRTAIIMHAMRSYGLNLDYL